MKATPTTLLAALALGCAEAPPPFPADARAERDVARDAVVAVEAALDAVDDRPGALETPDAPEVIDALGDAPPEATADAEEPRDAVHPPDAAPPDAAPPDAAPPDAAPPDVPPATVDAGGCRALAGGTLDVDIRPVAVTLRTTVNGAPPPVGYGFASIILRDPVSGDTATLGPVTAVTPLPRRMVLPGTYDVHYVVSPVTSVLTEVVVRNTNALVRRGVRVSAAGELAVDIPAVTLSGRLTLNGAAVPFAGGQIVLRNAVTGDEAMVSDTRPPTYSARVVPGTYDVYYRGSTMSGLLRNTNLRLRAGLAVTADTVYDIDLRRVELRGTLRSPRPAASGGFIELRDPASNDVASLGDVYSDIVVSGGTYYAPVAPGTYDVYYTNPSWDLNHAAVRNASARIQEAARVDASRTWDVRVPAVSIRGALTVNGLTQPPGGRIFLRTPTDLAWYGFTNEASAQASVVTGVYDVYYETPSAALLGSYLRNRRALVRAGLAVTAAGTIDVDVAAGSVRGRVTVNGAQGLSGPGAVYLRDPATGDMPPLVATATTTPYIAPVIAGTYDVVYRGALLPQDNASVRNTELVLRRGVVVGAATTLDVDVRATPVTGTFTSNGAAARDPYGRIQLRRRDEPLDRPDLGALGNYRYVALVAAGTYDILFAQQNAGSTSTTDVMNTGAVLGCVVIP